MKKIAIFTIAILFCLITLCQPGLATNNFSTDSSVKALWRFEPGALLVDSLGGNPNLTNDNNVTVDTTNFWEGAGSALFTRSLNNDLHIPNSSLVSGFPLKSGDSVQQGTFCFWFKPTTIYSDAYIFSIGWGSNKGIAFCPNGGSGAAYIGWGHGSSVQWINLPSALTANHVYHCAISIDGINKILQVFIWDYTAGSLWYYNNNLAPSNQLSLGTSPLDIGGNDAGGNTNSGNIDEFVVFNRLLNLQEISNIRNGTYTGPYTPASPGNNFTGDSRFQARWRFEAGALTTDSLGIQPALTPTGTPVADPFGVEEGSDAVLFPAGAYYTQSSLGANFPFISTDTKKQGTFCCWYIPQGWPSSYSGIWQMYNVSLQSPSASINSSGHLIIYGGGGNAKDTGIILNKYGIYHVAVVIDGIGLTLHVRVYDAIAKTAANYDTAIASCPLASAATIYIGIVYDYTTISAWLDELVVANALLSDATIDQIRKGVYFPGAGAGMFLVF